ncbi:tyrosine-type recombinase/integrase [Rhizobium sp. YTU87027]|uniref:tyrosine-type recombinase/integrase n=1 Tax=Rhizobium sp. YTU87027 TaxID=3417741 RepID=UPI003D680E83
MARKSKFLDFPHVLQLKNGKLVFRHPRIGQKTLPADIGSEEFAAAYEKLRLLVDAPAAEAKPAIKKPTFRDAFIAWQKSDEWKAYEHKTIKGHVRHALAFLEAPMTKTSKATFAEAPVDTPEAEMLPCLRKTVASHAPHKAKRVAIVIRKLFAAAIREEWCLRNLGSDIEQVELPPSSPEKVWPDDICEKFERRHQPGSGARTAYALARYGVGRRGDVAKIEWDNLRTKRYIDENDQIQVATVIEFMAQKNQNNGGSVKVTVVVRAELEMVLNALDRSKGGTILKTQAGKPFSPKSLSNQMQVWARQAGLEPGYTLHGLRRTFGSEIAEGGADLFTVQKAMGHRSPTTTAIYMDQLNEEPMAFRAAAAAKKRSAEVKRLRAAEK